MTTTKIIAAMLLATACCAVSGQEGSRGLRVVDSFDLHIDELNAQGVACNLSVDSIDAAMRLTLSNTKLKVLKAGEGSMTLNANVNIVWIPSIQLCAVTVALQFRRLTWTEPNATGVPLLVASWQRSSILTGRPLDMGRRVAETVEDQTKLLIAAWLKEN